MKKRGFTLIELLVVIAIIALLIGILLPALAKARQSARQIKDSSQIRGIIQGAITFAQNNNDEYPLPSRLDKANGTLAAPAVAMMKDSTRNILSVLIWGGFTPVEMFISPAENNADVKVMDNYEFDKPKGVTGTPTNGQNALWDPKFRGASGDSNVGGAQTELNVSNNSYAHNPPFLKRKAYWANNFTATEAVLGNRGPDFVLTQPGTATTEAVWDLVNGPTGSLSNTLAMHGSRNKWEGMVGYNDNHVNYELRADVETLLFTFTNLPQGGRSQKDNVFMNEDDQNQVVENYSFSTTANNNSNALLRPYRDTFTATAGANTTVNLQGFVWID